MQKLQLLATVPRMLYYIYIHHHSHYMYYFHKRNIKKR